MVTNLNKIGEAFKKDDSIEYATKIIYIVNARFQIRTAYDACVEVRVMAKLNIKYFDTVNSMKRSVARIIDKRQCNSKINQ